jgi:hypothetical protein
MAASSEDCATLPEKNVIFPGCLLNLRGEKTGHA